MAAEPLPVEIRFDGNTPFIAIVLEFERAPMVLGTLDAPSAFAIGRWLADKPEWHAVLQEALKLYADDRERAGDAET